VKHEEANRNGVDCNLSPAYASEVTPQGWNAHISVQEKGTDLHGIGKPRPWAGSNLERHPLRRCPSLYDAVWQDLETVGNAVCQGGLRQQFKPTIFTEKLVKSLLHLNLELIMHRSHGKFRGLEPPPVVFVHLLFEVSGLPHVRCLLQWCPCYKVRLLEGGKEGGEGGGRGGPGGKDGYLSCQMSRPQTPTVLRRSKGGSAPPGQCPARPPSWFQNPRPHSLCV